jgi:glycosyltransferase involved in cell wall biosynthesis
VVIAINTRFLIADHLEGMGWYTYELCQELVRQHPEDQFLFFFDRPYAPEFIFGPNVTPIVLSPQSHRYGLWYFWLEWQVARMLRKYRADVFFSPDNFLSLRSKTPTLMTIHDIAYVHYPELITRMSRWHYRNFQARYLQRADHIVAVSEFSRQDVLQHFPIDGQKITAIPNGFRSIFAPLTAAKKTAIQHQYSQGQDYFFYLGSLHPRKNLSRLIEAYDLFRKKTGAPVKLLIGGRMAWQTDEIKATWEKTTYREDIHFLGFLPDEQLAAVMGAALVLTYVSLFEGFGLPVLEAMQAGVPVLSSTASSLPEVAGDAAVLVDPLNVEAIAEGMTALWQSPELRQELIAKGKLQVAQFSWAKAAAQTYNLLKQLAKK